MRYKIDCSIFDNPPKRGVIKRLGIKEYLIKKLKFFDNPGVKYTVKGEIITITTDSIYCFIFSDLAMINRRCSKALSMDFKSKVALNDYVNLSKLFV